MLEEELELARGELVVADPELLGVRLLVRGQHRWHLERVGSSLGRPPVLHDSLTERQILVTHH